MCMFSQRQVRAVVWSEFRQALRSHLCDDVAGNGWLVPLRCPRGEVTPGEFNLSFPVHGQLALPCTSHCRPGPLGRSIRWSLLIAGYVADDRRELNHFSPVAEAARRTVHAQRKACVG